MLTNNSAYKYENPHTILFVIIQCWNNGTITLQSGAIKINHNIRPVKPYISDTSHEGITTKICMKM